MTSPFDATSTDASALAEELSRARIIDSERLAMLRAERPGATATELVEQLRSQNAITEFQAGRILAGETKQLIVGPYRLTDLASSHGFGRLRTAIHISTGQPHRVRLFPVRSLWQARVAKRLVQAQSQLPKHSTLIPLTDVDTAHGQHYLVWPWMRGDLLTDIIREAGAWAPEDAARLIRTLATGLAICHRHGLEHGFLHPNSVLIDASGEPRLLDLGAGPLLAQNLSEAESMLDSLSEASYCAKLIATAAPELLDDPTALSPAADQYGLGVIAHYVLTSLRPIEEESLLRTLVVRRAPIAPIRDLDASLPEALAKIVDRMLSVDPADRFLSMDEVIESLTGYLGASLPLASISEDLLESETILPMESPNRGGSGSFSSTKNGALSWSSSGSDPAMRSVDRDDSDDSVHFDLPEDHAPDSIVPAVPISAQGKVGFNLSVNVPDQSLLETQFNHPEPGPENGPTPSSGQAMPAPLPDESRLTRLLSSIEAEKNETLQQDPQVPLLLPVNRMKPQVPVSPPRPSKNDSGAMKPFVGQPAKTDIEPGESETQSVLWKTVKRNVLFWQAPADRMQVSLFGPSSLVPGSTTDFELFLHTPDAADSVRTMSRAFLRESERIAFGKVAQEVKRESNLAVHIAVANAGLSHSLVEVMWRGQPHRVRLTVHVPWESPAGQSPGIISIGKDNVRIGRIDFQVNILQRTSS